MANDKPNDPKQPEPEIEPLSDESLEEVSGGLTRIETPASSDSCCSCTSCS